MGYKFGKVAQFGTGNTFSSYKGVFASSDSKYSLLLGYDNTATGLRDSVVIGSGNVMKSGSAKTYAIGDTNNFASLAGYGALAYAFGYGNTLKDAGVAVGILNEMEGFGGICAGYGSKVTGDYATAIGYGATGSAASGLALGANSVASATNAFACQDANATARDSIAMGENCHAVTSGAVAIGREISSNTNRNGSMALCTYPSSNYSFRKGFGQVQTTDATQTVLYLNNAGSSAGAITCVESQVLAFDIIITGKKSDNTEGAMFRLEGACRRASGGNVTLIGSVTKTVLCRDDSNWDVAATVDTGTQSLQVKVTGVAATTIDWFATINFHEIGN